MADRFFIAPYDSNSGLQNYVRPWLIPDQAFAQLTNAYVWRGRVRKRFGSYYMGNDQKLSRLRMLVDTTDNGGTSSGVVPGSPGIGAIGQMFSIGDELFTVYQTSGSMYDTGNASTKTFDTTSGAFVFTGVPALTPVYWYPALPVMGLLSYERDDLNNEQLIAFDTRFAYAYSNGFDRLSGEITSGAAEWHSTSSQFFWGTTWTGQNQADKVFFVTNFRQSEPNYMRSFFANQWDNFRPAIDGSNYINSARIIIPFKNRLLLFNTWEGTGSPGINYPQRVAWSALGSPLDTNAFRRDIAGKGSALDASTTEAIVSVEYIRDRLIVGFERSTWELVYTGNQVYPFTFQKINTELGIESTFSTVPFDKAILGVGQVGIIEANPTNVQRIDQAIPQEVFNIRNNNDGVYRVHGIRDYDTEMVYWTFPGDDQSDIFPYPNRVLVYNYLNGTWSFNDDSFTTFGYFFQQSGITWDSMTVTWDDPVSWDSGALQALHRQVIAGNQEGYVLIIDSNTPINAGALQITNISVSNSMVTITARDHNLREGDYIYLDGIVDNTGNLDDLNDTIQQVISSSANPIGQHTFSFIASGASGSYQGGGTISRVSNIQMATKQFNFYEKVGRNASINKIDFMVDKEDGVAIPQGSIDVDFFVSTSLNSMLTDSENTGALIGTGTLDTYPYAGIKLEAQASRLWRPVYIPAQGECIQLKLSMNDAQMRSTINRNNDFQLHAICIHARPTSVRFQ